MMRFGASSIRKQSLLNLRVMVYQMRSMQQKPPKLSALYRILAWSYGYFGIIETKIHGFLQTEYSITAVN